MNYARSVLEGHMGIETPGQTPHLLSHLMILSSFQESMPLVA